MPISFPASPATNQTYTYANRTYRWTGAAWEFVASGGSGLTWSSVPASAFATGTAGQIAYDNAAGFFYVATATNTWKRTPLSTWTPVELIAGLQAWFDASDTSTLFNATAGGSLVSADGAVARWQDKSGNNRHFTQATSGSRPTRKTAAQGGKDVLRFDGSDDFMSIASSTATFKFLHDGDATVFAVYRWTAPAGAPNRRFLFSNHIDDESVSGTTGSAMWMRNDFGSAAPYSKLQFLATNNGSTRTNSYTGDNSYAVDTFHCLSFVADNANASNASRAVFRKSGTVQADTAAGDDAALPTANASYDLHICTQAGPTNRYFAQCDLCEIVMYDTALSDTDRAAVESYLMQKWSIT
jgi:hypothetical protein